MQRRSFLKSSAAAGFITIVSPRSIIYSGRRSTRAETVLGLEEGFRQPPFAARPFTWWHWMNGNVTKQGITLDLEAMARVGIGGFQAFSVSSGIPKGPADYLSAQWVELMEHAGREAERLGLEFDVHNCMGWSSSGGSWITPELSMQQLVWSESFVRGGKILDTVLPTPFKKLDFYRDTFVLAFPSPAGETRPFHELPVKLTTSSGVTDIQLLTSSDFSTGIDIQSTPGYLLFEFNQPFEARAICVYSSALPAAPGSTNTGTQMDLEASDDGRTFRKLSDLSRMGNLMEVPSIANFPATRARFFRLNIPSPRRITGLRLLRSPRISEWPTKANFPNNGGAGQGIGAELPNGTDEKFEAFLIDPASILDLTQNMDKNGKLHWQAPEGEWTILRFGHTTTGITNHPASGAGLGLECDKYSSAAFEFHFDYMLDKLMPALKPLAAKGKLGMLVDSYEVNMQNWTKELPAEFTKRRAYDLWKYLPVMTGRAVGSAETSERFLWDFRRTCADMMADHYQGRFAELCRKNNIISYTEAYNNGPFEEMQAGARVDINMGEFWIKTSHFRHSLKLAASIQNMNGRQVVGAESFTGQPFYSRWQEYPFAMKAQGDFMFTRGLNRYIFHRYAQQPHPTALPGMTMGQWGFHFDRTNTWFNQGKAWLDYVCRCQYLLQQGLFVGDLICYSGEDAPGDDLSMGALVPDLPDGYDFEYANTEILLKRIKIDKGDILLPDGMRFRLLVLPPKKRMTLEVLTRLENLVHQGMILVGPKPIASPTLIESDSNGEHFRQMADKLWEGANGAGTRENKYGSGRVFSGQSLAAILDTLAIKPDFSYTSRSGIAVINYIHRNIEDSDVYFIANRRRFSEDLVCSFRIEGKTPEFWNAVNGDITPVAFYQAAAGITILPIHLEPGGSMFVRFSKTHQGKSFHAISKNGKMLFGVNPFPSPKVGLHKGLTNNFTISVWVKPETEELIPTTTGPASRQQRPLANYVLYPPPGELIYGEGHASAGLLVARNCAVVYERDKEIPSAVLIATIPVSSWTHFAVVYQAGTPALYVNGSLIKKGERSHKTIHPGVGEPYKDESTFYYEADMGEPEVFENALEPAAIKALVAKGVPRPYAGPSVEQTADNQASLLFWENGEYTLLDSNKKLIKATISGIAKPVEIAGPWQVSFPPALGAPPQIKLTNLVSLHTHADAGVKYFSGTATYQKTFTVPAKQAKLFLDLGRVAVIAEVILNEKSLGILWKPPYRIEITNAIKQGTNNLQIKVTNLWPNRLIGDEQLPPEDEFAAPGGAGGMNGAAIKQLPPWYLEGKPKPEGGRVTFATWKHFNKESPLLESGLIGPVQILSAMTQQLIV